MHPVQIILYQTFLAIFAFYFLWRLSKYIIKYLQWCNASRKIISLGKNHPVWGSLLLFNGMGGALKLAAELQKNKGTRIYSWWIMFLYPIFFTCHPETAKVVLKSSSPKSKHHPSGVYKAIHPWLGDGLLLSSGKKWERTRKLITPGFHFDILRQYVSVFNRATDLYFDILQKGTADGSSVEVFDLTANLTLDIMLRCAFSFEEGVQRDSNLKAHPYVVANKMLGHAVMKRVAKPWLANDFIYWLSSDGRAFYKNSAIVHKFADDLIQKRKVEMKTNGKQGTRKYLDFLDILLAARDESGKGLTDKEIRDEVDTFLFGGHDTTASGLSWAIYCMGNNPEAQEKLYNEAMEVLGDEQDVKWEHFSSLKYTGMFIKEVLRMYTPIPAVGRWLTEPLVIDGVKIPKGTTVYVSIYGVNHHPDVWPDHDDFRPERFSDELKYSRDPYSYTPFSAGLRNCIGQNFALYEMKVMLSRFVRRFKVSLDPDHSYKMFPTIVMRSRHGIKVKLTERNKSSEPQ